VRSPTLGERHPTGGGNVGEAIRPRGGGGGEGGGGGRGSAGGRGSRLFGGGGGESGQSRGGGGGACLPCGRVGRRKQCAGGGGGCEHNAAGAGRRFPAGGVGSGNRRAAVLGCFRKDCRPLPVTTSGLADTNCETGSSQDESLLPGRVQKLGG